MRSQRERLFGTGIASGRAVGTSRSHTAVFLPKLRHGRTSRVDQGRSADLSLVRQSDVSPRIARRTDASGGALTGPSSRAVSLADRSSRRT